MVLRAGATPDGIARMGKDAMEGYSACPTTVHGDPSVACSRERPGS